MNPEAFRSSILWFSFGIVLNRIKYILLSIMIFRLGLTNLAIFYVSVYFVNEFSSFANRLVSSSYNRFLRNQSFISNEKNLHAAINSSLQLSFILGLASLLVVFFLAKPIALLIRNDSFVQTIQLFSLAVPFIILTNQITQILTLLARFREAVILHYILDAAFVLVSAYIAVFIFKSSLHTVLVWQIIALVLSSLMALFVVHRSVPTFRLSVGFPQVPIHISSTIFSNALFIMIFSHSDVLVVGYYYGSLVLGKYIALLVAPHIIYAIATNMFAMFLHVADSFYTDIRRVTLFAQRVLQYILLLAIPLTVLLILYPQRVVNDIMKIHVLIDSLALQMLSIAFFMRIIAWVAGQILIIRKKSKENMRINVLLSLIAVPLLILITPIYGFVGVASVLLAIAIFETCIKSILTYKKTGVHFISAKSIKISFIGICLYFIYSLLLPSDFGLSIFSFPFIFFIALLAFRCIDSDDWAILVRQMRSSMNMENNQRIV